MPFSLLPSDLKVFIAVSFPSSKGTRYPLAVRLAMSADCYREGCVAGQLVHVAGYRHSVQGIQRAIALIEYASTIRACLVSNGSSLWGPTRTLRVLRCYLGALSLPDPFAYCQTPYAPLINVLLYGVQPDTLPCKLIEGYFVRNWHSTGTIPEQLQAAAVEAGCEWCPLWRAAICTNIDPLQSDHPSLPLTPPLLPVGKD